MLIPSMPEILDRIEAFLERHGMPPSTFGREATGEPQLIKSMKDGRSPSHRVLERVADFMADYDLQHPAPEPGASTDNGALVIGSLPGAAASSAACPGPVLRQAQPLDSARDRHERVDDAASGRTPGSLDFARDERSSVEPGDSAPLRTSLFEFAEGRRA